MRAFVSTKDIVTIMALFSHKVILGNKRELISEEYINVNTLLLDNVTVFFTKFYSGTEVVYSERF
jgi:hypothetical protein